MYSSVTITDMQLLLHIYCVVGVFCADVQFFFYFILPFASIFCIVLVVGVFCAFVGFILPFASVFFIVLLV